MDHHRIKENSEMRAMLVQQQKRINMLTNRIMQFNIKLNKPESTIENLNCQQKSNSADVNIHSEGKTYEMKAYQQVEITNDLPHGPIIKNAQVQTDNDQYLQYITNQIYNSILFQSFAKERLALGKQSLKNICNELFVLNDRYQNCLYNYTEPSHMTDIVTNYNHWRSVANMAQNGNEPNSNCNSHLLISPHTEEDKIITNQSNQYYISDRLLDHSNELYNENKDVENISTFDKSTIFVNITEDSNFVIDSKIHEKFNPEVPKLLPLRHEDGVDSNFTNNINENINNDGVEEILELITENVVTNNYITQNEDPLNKEAESDDTFITTINQSGYLADNSVGSTSIDLHFGSTVSIKKEEPKEMIASQMTDSQEGEGNCRMVEQSSLELGSEPTNLSLLLQPNFDTIPEMSSSDQEQPSPKENIFVDLTDSFMGSW